MRYLLDTNVISSAVEGRQSLLTSRIRRASTEAEIVTSIIVVSELRFGYTKISSVRLKEAYELFLEGVVVENWDVPFDQVYADLRSGLERRGKSMGAMDMLIAAHALATNCVVVTDDRAFENVPGLKVENWLRDDAAPTLG